MYDTIIIGAGPAGLTAAIYLARKKIRTLVLTDKIGGQIMDGPLIENYPGFEKITGPEWIEKVSQQVKKLKVEIKANQPVRQITKIDRGFEVEIASGEKFQAKSIIITSGKRSRQLNVPGEKEFLGKGISPCVTCDGPLFAGKDVAVVGGGNSAISAALELEKYVKKVYIINLGQDLVGEEVRIDQIKKSSKVEVIPQAKTTAILGDQFVSGLKYKDLANNQEKELALQGVFIEIGWQASTEYLRNFVELTPSGDVKIDKKNATNVPGIFAAGDVTEVKDKQIIIACGEAAKAALACWDYLSSKK